MEGEILKLKEFNMIKSSRNHHFFSGRFNGKVAVVKSNGDWIPLENGDDPIVGGEVYKDDLRICSLNDLTKGFDDTRYPDEKGQFDKSESSKWPKERKPSIAHVRQGQCIIRSGASAANLPTYMASANL